MVRQSDVQTMQENKLVLTKEHFVYNTNEDEIFAVLESAIVRINEKREEAGRNDFVNVLDRELRDAAKSMIEDYATDKLVPERYDLVTVVKGGKSEQ